MTLPPIEVYLKLLDLANAKAIGLREFEVAFTNAFKAEKRILPDQIYQPLNYVFTSLDMWSEKLAKIDKNYITTRELRKILLDRRQELWKLGYDAAITEADKRK